MSDPAVEERLRSLLTAAAAPAEPGELPGERQALSAFRAAVDDHSRRFSMGSRTTPLKAAAVAFAGVGALLVGGTAAAATGVLPDAAQDTARNMLEKVGVAVPGAEEPTEAATPEGQGEEISELAKVTEPGPEHGATVSGAASDKEDQTDSEVTPETGDETSTGMGGAVSEQAHTADTEGGKGEEVAPLASEGKAGGAAAGPEDTETDTTSVQGTAQSSGAGDNGEQKADDASGGRSTAGTAHRP